MLTFLDLPLDILLLVFPYLEAKDFLSLTTTCKALHDTDIRQNPFYWTHATRSKFRVRNRPAANWDGAHWQRLYRRLLTQSRIYVWGNNDWGTLGLEDGLEHQPPPIRPIRGRIRGPGDRRVRQGFNRSVNTQCKGPVRMHRPKGLGVVADLQCGGWSTSVLNDRGVIFTAGVLNANGYPLPTPREGHVDSLKFPAGDPAASPSTTIQKFSSGRAHVLGLSDNGIIWSWYDAGSPAVEVVMPDLVTTGQTGRDHRNFGMVRDVVAGWTTSAAYIQGVGIVTWNPVSSRTTHVQQQDPRAVLNEWKVIPRSSYFRPRRSEREDNEDQARLGTEVGEVVNFIILEAFVVFVTDIGKIFGSRISWDRESGVGFDSFELPEFQASVADPNKTSATDIQGSFRAFASFHADGRVLVGHQDHLEAIYRRAFLGSGDRMQQPDVIPALQHNGVIQVAFGDYHFHALHSDGSITSYGFEPQNCGALGLGAGEQDGGPLEEQKLRGMYRRGLDGNVCLAPHGYVRGRKVWFQKEKATWLRFMSSGGADIVESQTRRAMLDDNLGARGEVSEYFEQQAEGWDRRSEVRHHDDDGLGAHFALNVAAAGWHSGALVLVNEELETAVAESCLAARAPKPYDPGNVDPEYHASTEVRDGHPGKTGPPKVWESEPFPRLTLCNGNVMPGDIPISNWNYTWPDWVSKLDYRSTSDSDKVFGISGWRITT